MAKQILRQSRIKTSTNRGVAAGSFILMTMPPETVSPWQVMNRQAKKNYKPRIIRDKTRQSWRERWPNG